MGRRAPLRHEEEEEANDDKLRALVSDDDAGGGRWRRREDHPSLAAASGEASASYASGAVSDSGTPSVVRSPRKRGGERAAAAFAHGQVEEAAAVYGPVGSARPMGQPQGEQQGAGTREGAAAGAEELDGVDAAFATEDRGRWKRRATRLVRMWRVSAFSGAGDGTGQAERSGVIHPGDLVTAVNGQTLLDPWLNWEDAIFRCGCPVAVAAGPYCPNPPLTFVRSINTAHAPFRLRVYRPTAEQGSPAHDSPTGAESGAAGGGEQSPAEGTESAPDVEEGAARPGPVEGAEVAPRPASGSLSGALGTGLGALGRGITYLPLRAMDVLDWLRTESHRRGTEEEEVDAEITVWEKPTGCVRLPGPAVPVVCAVAYTDLHPAQSAPRRAVRLGRAARAGHRADDGAAAGGAVCEPQVVRGVRAAPAGPLRWGEPLLTWGCFCQERGGLRCRCRGLRGVQARVPPGVSPAVWLCGPSSGLVDAVGGSAARDAQPLRAPA